MVADALAQALAAARRWFRTEARAYPWTATDDPYAIWVSEVMLQQTVVTAAVRPFEAWMERWPSVTALAAAERSEVLRAWEGLGYASRAANLHRAAQVLVSQGRTTLPSSREELLSLPGVGEYTAAALLSFAFHQPALTLDANLKRVFQRLDAEPEWTPDVEARWRERWATLVDGPSSRECNQAVMQLGQRVCRSRTPQCSVCPFAAVCLARQRGITASVPTPRTRVVVEKVTTVVFWRRGDQWWLAHPDSGRFSHLWLVAPSPAPETARRLSSRVHTYTKYRDRLTAWAADWANAGDPPLPPGWTGRWVDAHEAAAVGMVSVYRQLLDEALVPAEGLFD